MMLENFAFTSFLAKNKQYPAPFQKKLTCLEGKETVLTFIVNYKSTLNKAGSHETSAC